MPPKCFDASIAVRIDASELSLIEQSPATAAGSPSAAIVLVTSTFAGLLLNMPSYPGVHHVKIYMMNRLWPSEYMRENSDSLEN